MTVLEEAKEAILKAIINACKTNNCMDVQGLAQAYHHIDPPVKVIQNITGKKAKNEHAPAEH